VDAAGDRLKTALVTGATDRIGFETARQLAAQGVRVLVHGRNADKAAAAARRIAAGTPDAGVEPVAADLARMAEVVALARKYFVDCQAATPSRRARDDRLAETLWAGSERTLARWL
jgi:short-subunit dehydrogenase